MTANTNNTTRQPVPPTHKIMQVIEYMQGNEKKTRWLRVGSAWLNRDGQGMNLVFDAYPVIGRTVIRPADEKREETETGGQ